MVTLETRIKRRLTDLLTLSVVAMHLTAPAWSASPNNGNDNLTAPDLDEVLVEGARLSELRAAISAVEDKFYLRYNDINKRDEFDIRCVEQRRTGTLLVARRCYPVVIDTETRSEGLAFVEAIQNNGVQLARPRATGAAVVLTAKVAEYKSNMLSLLRNDAELRKLVREQEALQRKYKKAQRERVKGSVLKVE